MRKVTPDLKSVLAGLPAIIARAEVGRLLGGAIASKTLANLDSLGLGPNGRFNIGRNVVYTRENLISWLENRTVALI